MDVDKERLDKFLSRKISDISRTKIQSWIKAGFVCVNSEKVNDPNFTLKIADNIGIEENIPSDKIEIYSDETVPFKILFEDDNLLVVNKPAGVVVHPGAGNRDHTLVNGLAYHCGKNLSTINSEIRPGIVHRIDKDTSGILVIAKNNFAHMQLAKQFEIHSIKRKYVCFLYSVLRPLNGKIETLISRSESNRLKMAVSQSKGKKAVTIYKTIKNFSNYASKVECELLTGRTHQIRVHMSSRGSSLIGDKVYKVKNYSLPKEFAKEINEFPRQALHAYFLEFIHPYTDKVMHFECDMPDDMKNLENLLSKIERRN